MQQMITKNNLKIVAIFVFVSLIFFVVIDAQAAISNKDVLDSVLKEYNDQARNWAKTIQDAATWLFWTLALISMVWTFGMMALRKADLGEFFAEFIRFIIFTGFFWWLLLKRPKFSQSIYDSLRQIAGTATGT